MSSLVSWFHVLSVALAVLAAEPATPTTPHATQPNLRVAFSRSQFVGVHENDALAAMKVYFKNIAEDSGMTVELIPLPLDGVRTLAEILRENRADLLAMTSEEFLALEAMGLEGPLLLTGAKNVFTDEYVLLTHAESGLRSVADLKGRSLLLSTEIRASLARRWLEVLCQEHGLGDPEQALRKITPAAKPTLVVLPVFFRQADACILTRHGFEVMGELNPQVKKQLRVLAVSRPMVSTVCAFRRGFPEPLKRRVIDTALRSKGKPAFEQIMALFKSSDLSQQPVGALDSARELLATHRRLCGETNTLAGIGAGLKAASGKADEL